MLLYCHRCDRNVLPKPDGTCPGCLMEDRLGGISHDTRERWAKQEAAVQARATVRSQATLPPVCPFCGTAAEESTVLTWRRDSPHASGPTTVPGGLMAEAINTLFDRLARPREQVISFRLPHCSSCRTRKLEVLAIDWDNYSLDIACHPAFAARHVSTPNSEHPTPSPH